MIHEVFYREIPLRLIVERRLTGAEIVHYSDGEMLISSRHNQVFIERQGVTCTLSLPNDGIRHPLGMFRLARRALRLDKCNVIPVGDDKSNLVIIRQGTVYHYEGKTGALVPTLKLRNCRNVLHQSVAVLNGAQLYFGEYGGNRRRTEVPLYRSLDAGKHWHEIFTFPKGRIKHVHGVYWDRFEERLWVFTGDFAGECWVLIADKDFSQVEWLGDGQQQWRACNAFFERDAIYWGMDSQLEQNYLMRLDRRTRTLERRCELPGPVWYIKRLEDGYYLVATTCEIGPGVKDDSAHILASSDLENWEEVRTFRHDGLPKRYFKFGVVGFADGAQTKDNFFIFGEALKGLEGRSVQCKLGC